jgi:hypothetical protein
MSNTIDVIYEKYKYTIIDCIKNKAYYSAKSAFLQAAAEICQKQREMCRKAYQEQQRKYAYNSDDENEDAIINAKLEGL